MTSPEPIPYDKHEAEVLSVIDERDRYHDMADQLAAQIAAITGDEIGEHSSDNDPWRNAMLAADEWIARDLRTMLAASGEAAPAAMEVMDYPPLPDTDYRLYEAGSREGYGKAFDADQMHAYVDADRKDRQLAACNFCLAQAAEARAAATPAAPSAGVTTIGQRLAQLLDEDQWAECELLLMTFDAAPRALIAKWRHAAAHLGLEGLASLDDCADELEAALAQPAPVQAGAQQAVAYLMTRPSGFAWPLMPKDMTPEWREVCAADRTTIEPLYRAAPTQAGAGDAKGGA